MSENLPPGSQAGLDVDIQLLQSGSAVASAVAGGAIDIGLSSFVPLAVAHTKGIPFVIVAPRCVMDRRRAQRRPVRQMRRRFVAAAT